nr:hypothetical protein [Desulfosarcina cetonica]
MFLTSVFPYCHALEGSTLSAFVRGRRYLVYFSAGHAKKGGLVTAMATLPGRNPLKPGGGLNNIDFIDKCKGPVAPYAKYANGTETPILRVDEPAVARHRQVNVQRTVSHGEDTDFRKRAVSLDPETGQAAGACVRCIYEVGVPTLRSDNPAGRSLPGFHGSVRAFDYTIIKVIGRNGAYPGICNDQAFPGIEGKPERHGAGEVGDGDDFMRYHTQKHKNYWIGSVPF